MKDFAIRSQNKLLYDYTLWIKLYQAQIYKKRISQIYIERDI